jgi:hypothetical protein
LSLLNPPLSITTHQLEQAGQFSTRNDRLFVVKGLVPFRQSHLSVGNAACPVPAKSSFRRERVTRVPAKPSFRRARRLYRRSRVLKTPRILLYSHFMCFQSAVHNDHTQRRIEGEQHPRHTSVTTPSVSPYGYSRDDMATVPYTCMRIKKHFWTLRGKKSILFHIENCRLNWDCTMKVQLSS